MSEKLVLFSLQKDN